MALKRNPEALKELRVDVKTQEQWEELMSKEGLIIVDAYAGWCGPCKAIESTFRRIRNETGDDLLHFAMAETDNIESLEVYREKSRPTFLFYGGGQLVNVIRGCNAPLISRSITHFLSEEHRILNGDSERKVFVDEEAQLTQQTEEKQDEEKEAEIDDEMEIVEVPKEISVVIIKPDAVKSGYADDIIQNIEDCGIEILHKESKVLSKEEAAEFYRQHEGSEHFEQLIEFMSSGPVLSLVLSKKGDDPGHGLIPEVRDLIGPKDVNLAKEEAPNSIRAQYGTDAIMNAIHSCDSSESAARELAFFYPDFNIPKVQEKRKKQRIQRTLALIRPGAYAKRKDSILRTIEEAGFTIAMSKEMYLSREQAQEFYEEHKDQDYFDSLVNNMTSGPSLALCLAREDAVETWRNLLGPKDISLAKNEAPESLRAVFAEEDAEINPIHGAASVEAAEKELRTFFPPQATVAVLKPEIYSVPEQRDEIIGRIQQAGFNISAQKEINLTKELASQFYKEHEGKEFFDGLTEYMSSGPTLFMILSREDAVSGFRALVGPTEPEKAKEEAPNSLRALYATDSMKNAIHSSSNLTKAAEVIHEFFPEVELNVDGTVKDQEDQQLNEEGEQHQEEQESQEKEEGADEGREQPEGETATTDINGEVSRTDEDIQAEDGRQDGEVNENVPNTGDETSKEQGEGVNVNEAQTEEKSDDDIQKEKDVDNEKQEDKNQGEINGDDEGSKVEAGLENKEISEQQNEEGKNDEGGDTKAENSADVEEMQQNETKKDEEIVDSVNDTDKMEGKDSAEKTDENEGTADVQENKDATENKEVKDEPVGDDNKGE